jgi:hypothetical protein
MGILDNAIKSLAPKSNFTTDGKKITQWISSDIVQPTESEIEVEVARLQAEFEAKQYQRDRATAYPSIADQLDTLYHGGYDAWKATITAVKEEFPKP